MHNDRTNPAARASDAVSSDPPTRQRRQAAGTSSGDIVGHGDLTSSTPGASGSGDSFPHTGALASKAKSEDTNEGGRVHLHTGPDLPFAAGHGSVPPDSSSERVRPIFLVLAWRVFWAIGAALCVAAVCGCYLIAAAIWGPA